MRGILTGVLLLTGMWSGCDRAAPVAKPVETPKAGPAAPVEPPPTLPPQSE